MDVLIKPGHPLRGEIFLPGDKSISHRAALFGALAVGESQIENFLYAGVTRPLLNGLSALGVQWDLTHSGNKDGGNGPLQGGGEGSSNLTIHGKGIDHFRPPTEPINCQNSGGTIRFLTGALAAAGTAAVLDGSEGLRRRPMSRIIDPLRQMGVSIDSADGGRAPIILNGRPAGSRLQAIDYRLPVASAQVKTALVQTALKADGTSFFWEPYQSRDHTERMLRAMGADILSIEGKSGESRVGVRVRPADSDLSPLSLKIPGDFSSAAFLIVAALITPGSEITLRSIGLNPTRLGLLGVLARMGGSIQISNESVQGGEPTGDLVIEHSQMQGEDVSGASVVEMIDEFPIFGVASAYASGTSEVSQAQELRFKESDRIAALCGELENLGVVIQEKPDGFIVSGGRSPRGGEVESHGDHRLEMSLAVAGLGAQSSTRIRGAGIFAESFPEFFAVLQSLGANIQFL